MNIAGVQSFWFKAARGPKTLLAVFAHPDDESFGPGGTLARYAAEGVDVHYACATRGEVGAVNAELMQRFATVGDLRWSELAAATKILGLTGLHWLGYRDSGMPGSDDNRHPDALLQADQDVLIGRIVALIRALRPQVVMTFDSRGGYGHPDHISIHYATERAFAIAGDAAQYPEQIAQGLAPFAPQKLYYTAFPKGFLKFAVAVLKLLGRDPARFGRNQDINLAEIAMWEQQITTRIATGRYLDIKQKAGECHKSQTGPSGMFGWMPGPVRRWILGVETFTRAQPPVKGNVRLEADLFEGM
ncbi:MAG: PIG-L family deacetylase [Chloroflexota bacterium]